MVDVKSNFPNNLDSLQREVIELLDEIGILIDQTQANLSSDNATAKYSQFQQQIAEVSQNVIDLQLKMAIVAPMKAGKSTIINAIAGQQLLPNCAVAMTTIPTEIIFNSNITKPTLTLSKDTISIFRDIYLHVKQQITQLGIDSVKQKLSRYPHLLDLLTEMKEVKSLPFSAKVTGCAAISQTLNRLNHAIRLYAALHPLEDPLAQLKEVPKVYTPFLGLLEQEQTKNIGSLSIIDTPGPNEAAASLKLSSVVEEQLRRSSIVLIVLDYTQLNNEAAELIKRQVKPIIDLIGKQNLYVLVNKVDRRRKGDMTPKQVKDFVLADLDLSPTDDGERIFEISALRAFAATEFLLELKQRPGIQLLQMNSVESLAQEVFGIDWDEDLEDITVEILAQKAEKLWHKSGFAPFLNQAIAALMANAAPECLAAALNLSRYRLLELRDDLNLRSHAISQDTEKLQGEIKALEADLNYLESCRTRLDDIDKIKTKLQQKLSAILAQLKQEATVSVEDYFAEVEYEQGDLLKKADIKARDLLLSNVGDFELFPQWISKNLKSNLEYKTAGIITFTSKKEAEDFAEKAVVWSKQRLEVLLSKVRDNTEIEIQQAGTNLREFLIKETQPIIDRAKTRIQNTFEIELNLPSPSIPTEDDIEVERQAVKKKTRLVDRGYEQRLVKKRAWYYWFGVIPFYTQETVQKPYKKENYYIVSVAELVDKINASSEKFVDTVQEKISIYLDEDLQQQVNLFFAQLDDYLGNYLKSLQQAQTDHKLSLGQREKLANNLVRLVPKTTNYINRADNYLQQTESFLVNKK